MKQKTLDDFPEFVKINSAVETLRSEKAEVSVRLEQIEFELSQPQQGQADGAQAWAQVLDGKDSYRYGVDTRSELRDEQLKLEARLSFLDDVLTTGEVELDACRAKCSLAICSQIRPQWTAEIKTILESLKRICEANAALDRMRAELEAQGVRTGSLAYGKYDLGGEWNSPYGGRLVGHQRHAAENYPKLVAATGQGIKVKLAALARREEQFNNQGATE
jgi:hypothetical protein